MEKHMRNCRGHGDVGVMEVPDVPEDDDVRTRGTALAAMSEANSRPTKRKKVDDEEMNLSSSISQLTSPRQFVTSPEVFISQVNAGNLMLETGGSRDHFSGDSSDDVPASCCSSNRSSEEGSIEIDYDFHCRQSSETTPSSEIRSESGELESTARPLEANSSRRQRKPEEKSSAGAKFEAELEEFFLAGEKQHLKEFSNKYNFDFENEKPLEGRFEWVKLN